MSSTLWEIRKISVDIYFFPDCIELDVQLNGTCNSPSYAKTEPKVHKTPFEKIAFLVQVINYILYHKENISPEQFDDIIANTQHSITQTNVKFYRQCIAEMEQNQKLIGLSSNATNDIIKLNFTFFPSKKEAYNDMRNNLKQNGKFLKFLNQALTIMHIDYDCVDLALQHNSKIIGQITHDSPSVLHRNIQSVKTKKREQDAGIEKIDRKAEDLKIDKDMLVR